MIIDYEIMPLSGGGGFISNNILEALAGGVTGFPRLPYTKAAIVELNGDRAQILPAAVDVIREVFIRNTSQQSLQLFIGTQTVKMSDLQPDGHHWDNFNSGLPIEAVGVGSVEIIIRQNKAIKYEIGADMTFPVGVALRIGTGDNFGFVTQAFQDAPSDIFNQNVSKLFDSDDGITGHKLVVIHTFTPGAAIDFNVQIEGTRYDTTQSIQFQWINEVMVLRLALGVGADVINLELESLIKNVGGLLTQGGYAGECAGTGGVLTLKPNFMNMRGRFVAVDNSTGSYDTPVITRYEPNSDPFLGGTFILEGF